MFLSNDILKYTFEEITKDEMKAIFGAKIDKMIPKVDDLNNNNDIKLLRRILKNS